MDLQPLRAFLAVARHGSFNAAARSLRRTQPSISMSIRRLEEELEVRLLERSGRGSRLKEHGQILLAEAGPLLEDLERLPARLRELGREVGGTVRIGGGEGAVVYLLPAPIRALRRKYPHVNVVVRNQSLADTLAMLRAGELDLALRSLTASPPYITYRPCLTFDRVVIAPRGHLLKGVRRLSLKALAAERFVMPWASSTTRGLVESALAKEGLSPQVALEAGGWEVVKRYVALGAGIAVLPRCCIEPRDRAELVVLPARHLFGRDTYGLLTRRGKQLSRAARALANFIDPSFSTEIVADGGRGFSRP
jgi:DNA-binding transcriptional LysR family regulator